LDLLAILFFIGFLILQSMAESKRKQQAREQAEKRRLAGQPAGPVPAEELPPPAGRPQPDVQEREEPFPDPLPWELDEEEDDERREVFFPPKADQAKEKPVIAVVKVIPEDAPIPDWRSRVLEEVPVQAYIAPAVLPSFSVEDWTRGIVMAEILQPPRARRRFGHPPARRKVV
jgi:hypothetical protein